MRRKMMLGNLPLAFAHYLFSPKIIWFGLLLNAEEADISIDNKF